VPNTGASSAPMLFVMIALAAAAGIAIATFPKKVHEK